MGAMTLLTSNTLGSNVQTWTVSSIPQTARHLLIQLHIRCTGSDYSNSQVFINSGNNGGNYQIRDMYLSAASGGVMKQIYDNFASNPWLYLGSNTGTNANSDRYTTTTIFIPDYTNASVRKYVMGWGPLDPAGGNQNHEWCYGVVNVGAVTSMDFRDYRYSTVNIGQGSKVWIYGLS